MIKSHKRKAMLSRLKELSLGNPGFRVLCPTWCTVKAESYFGVYVLQLLLRHISNLSKTPQNSEMPTYEGQLSGAISIKKLEKMDKDDFFDSIWELQQYNQSKMEV